MSVATKRKVLEIFPEELHRLLCNFHITTKKKNNSKYETYAMSSISRSLQQFLNENNAKVNNLKDEEFKVSREVPKCKRRELRKQGKETKPNATVALTNAKKKTSLASMSLKYFRVRHGFF